MYQGKSDGVSVHDGFPNPATDASYKPIDLNELLVPHPAATFFMRLGSSEWESLGMFAGDLIIVDRAFSPGHNDLVIWWEGESFKISAKHKLPIDIPCWGVVTAIIHQYKQPPR